MSDEMKVEVTQLMHKELGYLRIFLRGGEVWYTLKDVCKMLRIDEHTVWPKISLADKDIAYSATHEECTSTKVVNPKGLATFVAYSTHPHNEEILGWINNESSRVKESTISDNEFLFVARDIFDVLGEHKETL